MRKLAALGSAVWLAGAVKFTLHVNAAPTLADYLAFRCGSGAETHGWLPAVHCWGCPAMAAGAALLVLAVSRPLWRTRPVPLART